MHFNLHSSQLFCGPNDVSVEGNTGLLLISIVVALLKLVIVGVAVGIAVMVVVASAIVL